MSECVGVGEKGHSIFLRTKGEDVDVCTRWLATGSTEKLSCRRFDDRLRFHLCHLVANAANAFPAAYNASLERLQAEVDSMKNRLEKEKASMAASQAEVAALKASQERERERAKESLAKLETELERERQVQCGLFSVWFEE